MHMMYAASVELVPISGPSSDYSFSGPLLEPCYYCGLPASSIDHVIPRSLLEDLQDIPDAMREITAGRRLTVPACRECNCMLSDNYDETLADRKARLKERLRRKYRSILVVPDWNDDELEQVSEALQSHIRAGIAHRNLIRRRLAW